MLKVFTLDRKEEWDKIVQTFNNYDVYYLSGYVSAFKINGDGEPYLFYYEDENVKGINVVMKRDISELSRFKDVLPPNTFFDFVTPYGYGGWMLQGKTDFSCNLFEEYGNWCKENNIVCEFVRFHPVIGNYCMSDKFYDVVTLGNTVTLDISSPEVIWANISGKNRNHIRKAENSGVEIKIGGSEQLYDKFIEIYNKTMEYDNADNYYFFSKDFYDSIRKDLNDSTQIFYAVKDDVIIAAAIMIAANGKLNYHLSGSLYEYRSYAPTNLLLYKAALWGSANGYKTFHLGGGVGSKDDSLLKFKKSFYRSEDLTRFAIGKKIFIEEKYDELIKIRGEVDGDFFPKYRAK